MCCCLWVLRKLGKLNFPARGTRCHDGPVENANLILKGGGALRWKITPKYVNVACLDW